MQRLGLGTLSLNDPDEVLSPDTRRWAEEYARRQVGEIQDRIFPAARAVESGVDTPGASVVAPPALAGS